MTILIKNVTMLDKSKTNILIEDNIIKTISNDSFDADTIIDGTKLLAMPPFYNMHTHSAMTLFRGYGEDLPLMEWLEKYIWPIEAQLTEKDKYDGTRLACLEMIKTGTIFFMDMYWHINGTFKAVQEMGMRANLSAVMLDQFDAKKRNASIVRCKEEVQKFSNKSELIQIGLGPHAIYTVSPELLQWAAKFAIEHNLIYHIHLSETQFEVNQ